mmetsp:Transcript_42437/g.57969  ORF Transcript_42437/g.57969 Transcript_42437/m.57969 type:complete len:358 (+) Transcript_42437:94-1167(+)
MIVDDRVAEGHPDLTEVVAVEVKAVQVSVVRPTEGSLQSVRVTNTKLFGDNTARGGLPGFLDREGTVREAHVLLPDRIPAEQLREDPHRAAVPRVRLVLLVVTPVHEHVHLPAVPVQVAVHNHIPHAFLGPDEVLRVEDGRVESPGWLLPLPVQVHPAQVAPVVSEEDAVGVQHRDDLEDEQAPQQGGFSALTRQEVEDPPHHPRSLSLPRVDPPCEEDALLLRGGSLAVHRLELLRQDQVTILGDRQDVAVVPIQRLAQHLVRHVPRDVTPLQERVEVALVVSVRVGVRVGQQSGGAGGRERYGEGEGVVRAVALPAGVRPAHVPRVRIGEVGDAGPRSVPPVTAVTAAVVLLCGF